MLKLHILRERSDVVVAMLLVGRCGSPAGKSRQAKMPTMPNPKSPHHELQPRHSASHRRRTQRRVLPRHGAHADRQRPAALGALRMLRRRCDVFRASCRAPEPEFGLRSQRGPNRTVTSTRSWPRLANRVACFLVGCPCKAAVHIDAAACSARGGSGGSACHGRACQSTVLKLLRQGWLRCPDVHQAAGRRRGGRRARSRTRAMETW
jgi:hypothetical protein